MPSFLPATATLLIAAVVFHAPRCAGGEPPAQTVWTQRLGEQEFTVFRRLVSIRHAAVPGGPARSSKTQYWLEVRDSSERVGRPIWKKTFGTDLAQMPQAVPQDFIVAPKDATTVGFAFVQVYGLQFYEVKLASGVSLDVEALRGPDGKALTRLGPDPRDIAASIATLRLLAAVPGIESVRKYYTTEAPFLDSAIWDGQAWEVTVTYLTNTYTFRRPADSGEWTLKPLPDGSFLKRPSPGEQRACQRAIDHIKTLGGLANVKRITDGVEWLSVGFTDRQLGINQLQILRDLRNLRYLSLNHTDVSDHVLPDIAQRTELKHISINGSRITDAGLKAFAGRRRLQSLALVGSLIDGSGLDYLREIPELYNLDLSNCKKLADKELGRIANLHSLRTLTLNGTNISETGLRNLATSSSVIWLRLDETPITDEALARLAGMTALGSLSLRGTNITDAGLRHLGALPKLADLYLRRCPITDKGLENLRGLSLHSLDLEETSVSDAGLASLREMKSLLSLSLIGTRVTDNGVHELQQALLKLKIYRERE